MNTEFLKGLAAGWYAAAFVWSACNALESKASSADWLYVISGAIVIPAYLVYRAYKYTRKETP